MSTGTPIQLRPIEHPSDKTRNSLPTHTYIIQSMYLFLILSWHVKPLDYIMCLIQFGLWTDVILIHFYPKHIKKESKPHGLLSHCWNIHLLGTRGSETTFSYMAKFQHVFMFYLLELSFKFQNGPNVEVAKMHYKII